MDIIIIPIPYFMVKTSYILWLVVEIFIIPLCQVVMNTYINISYLIFYGEIILHVTV